MLAQDPDLVLSPQHKDVFDAIERSATILSRLTEEVSLLADLAQGNVPFTPVTVTVESLVAPLAHLPEVAGRVEIEGTAGDTLVVVDPVRMRQALTSLTHSIASAGGGSKALGIRHLPHPTRSGTVIILLGVSDAVGAWSAGAAGESTRPHTVGEATARGLVQAQAGEVDLLRRGLAAVRIPMSELARA